MRVRSKDLYERTDGFITLRKMEHKRVTVIGPKRCLVKIFKEEVFPLLYFTEVVKMVPFRFKSQVHSYPSESIMIILFHLVDLLDLPDVKGVRNSLISQEERQTSIHLCRILLCLGNVTPRVYLQRSFSGKLSR